MNASPACRSPLRRLVFLVAAGLAAAAAPAEADLIVAQGFEGSAADTYAFTTDPAPFGDGSGATFQAVSELAITAGTIAPQTGAQFWGLRDTDNGNSRTTRRTELNFAPLDLTNFENVEVSFFWRAINFNSNPDVLAYALDGGTEISLWDRDSTPDDSGWRQTTLAIDDSATSVSLSLIGGNNQLQDAAGWDSVLVTADLIATQAIPEPASVLLMGLAAFGGLVGRRRSVG